MPPSAFDDIVESVRSALNAKRTELAERGASIEAALRAYERAVELEIAEAFAQAHQLKHPLPGERAADAARKLARAVAQLPELSSPSPLQPPSEPSASVAPAAPAPKPRQASGKLVIIGALSGREKSSGL